MKEIITLIVFIGFFYVFFLCISLFGAAGGFFAYFIFLGFVVWLIFLIAKDDGKQVEKRIVLDVEEELLNEYSIPSNAVQLLIDHLHKSFKGLDNDCVCLYAWVVEDDLFLIEPYFDIKLIISLSNIKGFSIETASNYYPLKYTLPSEKNVVVLSFRFDNEDNFIVFPSFCYKLLTKLIPQKESSSIDSIDEDVSFLDKESFFETATSDNDINIPLLKELAELKDLGILTEEEFELKKKEILRIS